MSADAAALSRAAADHITELALEAVRQRGRFVLALAGGSTPRATYAELASRPVPWDRVHVFFSDERMVPAEHPESNCRMAREALLARVPIPAAHVHPVPTQLEPAVAARVYEEEIRAALPEDGGLPRFDLILLGLGTDGHTASLFPGTTALGEAKALVVSNWVPRLDTWRVTFTYPLLDQARAVMFLAAGADKARVVREVVRPAAGGPDHPAGRVRPEAGALTWFLDAAAAGALG